MTNQLTDTSIVRKNFNRAAKNYDQHSEIQRRISQHVLNALMPTQNNFNFIADFACGSGESTRDLIDRIQYKHCVAIDNADSMIQVAQEKLKNYYEINLCIGSFNKRLFNPSTFDLISCQMGLQWSCNITHTLRLFYDYLKPGGILVFTLPVHGNFPELNDSYKLPLPCDTKLQQSILKLQFVVQYHQFKTYKTHYENGLLALRSLKAIGANYNRSPSKNQCGLRRPQLKKIFTEHSSLTYHISSYIVRKPFD